MKLTDSYDEAIERTLFTADEIARLPQDKVVAIKQQCLTKCGDDFRMRVYCEDRQYDALKALIVRGSSIGASK